MHLKRWISGLILAPALVLFILFAPPWLFFLFILFLAFLGLQEYYRLALPGVPRVEKFLILLLSFILLLALYSGGGKRFIPGLFSILLVLFIWALFGREDFSRRVEAEARHLLGLLYIPFLLGSFLLLRQMEAGPLWVIFTLVTVYFGDTTAFYVGRAWGKRKLAPAISPGKTVEGGVGAILGSLAGAVLFRSFFLPQISLFHALALGCGIGAVGQLGDLFESLLKRSAQVKDSGSLIPGHGGLLDRIDSVLFAGPFVYLFAWGIGAG